MIAILHIMSITSMIQEHESEEEFQTILPPVIISNPRKKIDYEKISITNIKKYFNQEKSQTHSELEHGTKANPAYPLVITWAPKSLFFEICETEITMELWLLNCGNRTIYIHCCGLWNDEARLGAGWRCYPRTRLRMVPGLKSKLFIKAKPRGYSPVPNIWAGLQLAAAHMRDLVTGYFVVPIQVKFLNYVPPNIEEIE